jgi:hypothetical protein
MTKIGLLTPSGLLSCFKRPLPALLFCLSLGLTGVGAIAAQKSLSLSVPPVSQATATERIRHKQEQINRIALENYDLGRYPITDAQETHWRQTLWATALLEPQDPQVIEALVSILSLTRYDRLSASQARTVEMGLQISNQYYLSDPDRFPTIEAAFQATVSESSNSQWVALALAALSRGHLPPEAKQQLIDLTKARFPHWVTDIPLYSTLQDLKDQEGNLTLPPLADLLTWPIAPHQLQLYVLCRPHREVLCRAVLRDATGEFVQEGGALWSVLLSSRSLHNLPWNFRRGETPQGIYRIEGTIPQPDRDFFYAYGLFPLVTLFVPFEPGVKSFLPGQSGTLQEGLFGYRKLLPPTWRKYFPIEESYWAGKIGRGLFRVHGTGEATDFFTSNRRYPFSEGWNPAIGCLSAQEQYDDSGQLLQADMPTILAALTKAGGTAFTGYLVLVDVPSETQEPVSVAELETLLTEQNLRKVRSYKVLF